jgi:hypothetical protein
MTNFYYGCTKPNEVEQRYQELSKVYNNQDEMLKTIASEYSKLIILLGEPKPVEAAEEKATLSDKLKELMAKVDTSELGTEVLGNWLWITKNSFPIKDVLKSLGFRYSGNKKAWYYRSDEFRGSENQDPISLDMIRARYGTVVAH